MKFMFNPLINEKKRARVLLAGVFLLGIITGLFVYPEAYNQAASFLKNKTGIGLPELKTIPFRLGLDVSGGTSLIYQADMAGVDAKDRQAAMEGLKDVIERRVNYFGVQEPRVEIAKSGDQWRLIVELAGIKDINTAIEMIGQTPFLEFKEQRSEMETNVILEMQKQGNEQAKSTDPYFKETELTGRFLQKAEVQINPTTYEAVVSLQFNDEGAKLFAALTEKNIGKPIAIYIDGMPISAPVVQDVISDGSAQITGRFTVQQARDLANNLNQGALPVPISLVSQRSVGAILGADSLNKMLQAGVIGFAAIALFMIVYYRLGGLFSTIALLVYVPLVLAIFKLIPVTLTLSGIAGFLLSMGMAVDANILILERIKEEIRSGKAVAAAVKEGFLRAWPSIRDSNASSIITALVLYFFTTSVVRGFALTLLIGVLMSMFSAIFVSRTLILSFLSEKTGHSKFWFHI